MKNKTQPKTTESILFYNYRSGPYKYMSNFYPSPFAVDDKLYKTNEHYYQSKKFGNGYKPQIEQEIIEAKSAYVAFKLA